MTNPTFQSRAELEAWAVLESRKASINAAMMVDAADKVAVFSDCLAMLRRVTLAHSHLPHDGGKVE
jgi:hypothetical protein